MSTDLVWKVDPDSKVELKQFDPDYVDKQKDRNKADAELQKLSDELSDLQESMAAARFHSLLLILQGMDTSGKDGTIRHVLGHVNPQGCLVHSFKVPSEEEAAHDFLWRIHQNAPAKGVMGIFNRSHYEDVLIVRVHNLVPEKVWSRRYQHINNFEKLLADNGTIILKFFLHISFDEQEKRLRAREADKDKAWKVAAGDWIERRYWDDYQKAYEDALSKCSTKEAPWYIVPANHKWFRNLAIADTLVRTMRQYKSQWQDELVKRGEVELEKVRQLHAQGK